MKIIQATVERLLYIVLFLIFIIFIVFLILTVEQNKKLVDIGKEIENAQQTIIENQSIQSQAGKVYINCLVHVNPPGDVQTQINTCFNAAPKVKK